MAILKSQAIPIRITEYSETSLIAVFFTRDSGLVRSIFKGARRKAKAYENFIDLLVLGDLTFYERKSGLNILKDFVPRQTFTGLSTDMVRYRAAVASLEFIRLAAVENEPAPELFDLFREILEACAKEKNPWSAAFAFLLRGLRATGFAPELDACISCSGTDFPTACKARTAFSFDEGGILCKNCGTGRNIGMWLGGSALSLMRELRTLRPGQAGQVALRPNVSREVRGFLRRHCEFTFEQRLRMLK